MNARHQIFAQGVVHGAMPGDAALPFKGSRTDSDVEMAFAAFLKPGVTSVFFAVIDHLQFGRCECIGQPSVNFGCNRPLARISHHFFKRPLLSGVTRFKLGRPSRKGACP